MSAKIDEQGDLYVTQEIGTFVFNLYKESNLPQLDPDELLYTYTHENNIEDSVTVESMHSLYLAKQEKIKLAEEAKELVFQLSETQDRIFTNLIKMIGEEFDSDDPLWDYVYNGGEYAKKLFINNLK